MVDQVSRELGNVHHLGGCRVLEHRARVGRNRRRHVRGRRAVVGVHVLVDHAPHVAAFAAQNPLGAQTFGFGVHFGVELLCHVERGKGAEVAAFRRVGREGVVEIQFMEQHEVAHEGVDAGVGKHVAGGRDEQDFVALFVKGRFGADTGDGFAVIGQHFHDFHKGVGLDAKVVAGEATVFHGVHDPVDAKTHLVQQFAHDSGDFGRVDAVGAEERAAAAFSTLVGVVEEFLHYFLVPATGAHFLAKNLAKHGVVAAVQRAQKLGAQHGHVLGVVGAKEEVALVGASAATHADIHEQLERAVLFKALFKGVTQNLFPVFGHVPVFCRRVPLVGIGHVQKFHGFLLGRVAKAARCKFRLGVKPALVRKGRTAGHKHLRRR